MDWSFEEKSAWGSLLAVVISSWLFFPVALTHLAAGGELRELAGRAILVVFVIVVVEIVYHSIFAIASRNTGSDERDVLISMKADKWSGYVLAFGVCWIIGLIVVRDVLPGSPPPSSVLIAIYLLLALTVSEASKILLQIWYYRTGI
ncbi:MAG TPA: hypothetical protein PKH39_13285 [Woeseiaceae bacterium]|nr:hypothetical protein [Woeseiaceae bacterium]